MNAGHPDAKAAEATQKPQKAMTKTGFFCGFCGTFAASAFGLPVFWFRGRTT